MRFGLPAIFYATALIGAAIAVFSCFGIPLAALVILFWGIEFSTKSFKSLLMLVAGCIICCVGLCLPAIGYRGEKAVMNQCSSQLRQIGLAIHAYHQIHGSFPPAYLADKDGRPMHSWRVLLLPSLEEKPLYDRYDFSEPWNGPHNSRLADHAPWCYRCSSLGGPRLQQGTSYVAIVGPNTMWPGADPPDANDIRDKAEQTLLIVEAPDTDIHWMEPRDLSAEEFLDRYAADGRGLEHYHDSIGGHLSYSPCWMGLFADNHTVPIPASISRAVLESLITVNGGEEVSPKEAAGQPRRYWRWKLIISLIVFLTLVFLPVIFLPRHVRQLRTRAEAEA